MAKSRSDIVLCSTTSLGRIAKAAPRGCYFRAPALENALEAKPSGVKERPSEAYSTAQRQAAKRKKLDPPVLFAAKPDGEVEPRGGARRRFLDDLEGRTHTHSGEILPAAPALQKTVAEGAEDYASLHEFDLGNDRFGGVPILHHTSLPAFADACLIDGRVSDKLSGALVERLRRDADRSVVRQEAGWLGRLAVGLGSRGEATPSPSQQRVHLPGSVAEQMHEASGGVLAASAPEEATDGPPRAPGQV